MPDNRQTHYTILYTVAQAGQPLQKTAIHDHATNGGQPWIECSLQTIGRHVDQFYDAGIHANVCKDFALSQHRFNYHLAARTGEFSGRGSQSKPAGNQLS